MSLSHPCRDNTFGLFASPIQVSTLPLSLVTSTEISTWGLMNWKSETVPFKVDNFEVSYGDAPWCANAGIETKARMTMTSAMIRIRFFIYFPCRDLQRRQSADSQF